MIQTDSALYRGDTQSDRFFGSITEDNIFCVMEAVGGYTEEEGHQAIALLKDLFHTHASGDPTIIDKELKNCIREGNLPVRVSIALGIVGKQTMYLKTLGTGQIWLRRGTEFTALIHGNHSATGPIQPSDTFMFTTDSFVKTLAAPAALSSFIDNPALPAGIEELTKFMRGKGQAQGMALFARLSENMHTAEPQIAVPVTPQTTTEPKKRLVLPHLPNIGHLLQTNKKKKLITLGLVLTIVAILIWSVGFGYKRRQTAQALEKINHTKEIVTQKLNQSDEVAFLNPQRSLVLINEAHTEVTSLKNEIGTKYQKEVGEIESMVKQREDQITHKENKSADEFFDLTIDTKDAVGARMVLDGDTLAILDTKNGLIYTLSIEKKSLDKIALSEVKSATLAVQYENASFFFVPNQGLYKVDDSGKAKKVIETDKELGTVADIQVYNGNLYFLTPAKSNIYKYTPTESGYSEKTPYIKSDTPVSLSSASSLAIDSSVYVATTDQITKLTAGVSDEFKTVFPEVGVSIYKVITNADLEKVYAWDKQNGAMYVLGKNGTYERQVKSSAFVKADDVAVLDDTAYTLEKEKIYKIRLQ